MNGTKKIPKGQLQNGLVDVVQVTPVTLTTGGWSLVSGLYEYTYSNANILRITPSTIESGQEAPEVIIIVLVLSESSKNESNSMIFFS